MKWAKLTKKVLKSLAVPENFRTPFVVWNNRTAPDDEFTYDMVSFLDLKDCGLTDEEMKSCWDSMHHSVPPSGTCTAAHNRYEYTAEELLDYYTHYLLLETGKK
jgi:hypothetical protein